MTSKALYYTIVTGWSAFGSPIMKVTSEKRNQVYGSVDGEPTHRRKDDTRGKFDTIEKAEACRKGIREIVQRYAIEYKRLNDEMNKFHRSEYAEIEDLINGEPNNS